MKLEKWKIKVGSNKTKEQNKNKPTRKETNRKNHPIHKVNTVYKTIVV